MEELLIKVWQSLNQKVTYTAYFNVEAIDAAETQKEKKKGENNTQYASTYQPLIYNYIINSVRTINNNRKKHNISVHTDKHMKFHIMKWHPR